ncbi:polyadenylate-binding protein [Aduncisulcus paluster]|uniref:Polyadenylate-binding protein n=1 Tax=Aduncisulcus paluster TaxID=2918883 RepID=A0ABQ5KN33_9EUKA|nr:polyadenylate-binding protein [Aduncisulcus paluster]|eukprot:gnl/Carplike_NY0171/3125_a4198_505.p1 GENE.gnl/Carplike_NY0171/3125_a4198_505~~gnl/Carplike_NY0171/3125_a4198_505.p1  ORF type:complete len:297 (+),score=65.40 gnl/Carplike_NY0171/3125_a4198_505:62-952(+)
MSDSENRCLFVKKLSRGLSLEKLQEAFKEAGYPIEKIEIKPSKFFRNAILTFETHELAEKALASMNYATIRESDGREEEMNLTWFREQGLRLTFGRSILISNLPREAKASDISEVFAEAGSIESCEVVTSKRAQKDGSKRPIYENRGIIRFSSEKEAEHAIEQFDGCRINEQDITVQLFVPRKLRIREVFFNFIPVSWTKEQVHELASQAGEVEKLSVKKSFSQRFQNAQVTYKTVVGGARAIVKLNKKDVGEHKKIIVEEYQEKTYSPEQFIDIDESMYKTLKEWCSLAMKTGSK